MRTTRRRKITNNQNQNQNQTNDGATSSSSSSAPSLTPPELSIHFTKGDDGATASSSSSSTSPVTISYSGPIDTLPMSIIEQLWLHAPVSTYGDVRTLSSPIDMNVRNARELTMGKHFNVNQEVCNKMSEYWRNGTPAGYYGEYHHFKGSKKDYYQQ